MLCDWPTIAQCFGLPLADLLSFAFVFLSCILRQEGEKEWTPLVCVCGLDRGGATLVLCTIGRGERVAVHAYTHQPGPPSLVDDPYGVPSSLAALCHLTTLVKVPRRLCNHVIVLLFTLCSYSHFTFSFIDSTPPPQPDSLQTSAARPYSTSTQVSSMLPKPRDGAKHLMYTVEANNYIRRTSRTPP